MASITNFRMVWFLVVSEKILYQIYTTNQQSNLITLWNSF